MVRSCVVMIVSVALTAAMGLAPLIHLHVAGDEHHPPGVTHEHHALVHAHLAAHQVAPTPREDSTDTTYFQPREHGPGQFLDTMLTELRSDTNVSAQLEEAVVQPAASPAAGQHMTSEPRAHAPPAVLSTPSRAPPA